MSDFRTGFVTQVRLDLRDEIAFAGEHGFDYLEIMMDGEERRDRLADRTDEIAALLDDRDLDLAVHLPFPLDVGSPFEHAREGAILEHEACIRTAAELDAEKAVLHPESSAWSVAWSAEDVHPYLIDSVERLDAFGADRGVEVCAENLFDNAFTIRNFDALFAETDVSMTLDTGHARIEGFDGTDTAAFVEAHGDRISHVHLNETRGPADEHLPFGAGDVDFEAILDPLDEATLSLEVATFSLDYVATSKERLDAVIGG